MCMLSLLVDGAAISPRRLDNGVQLSLLDKTSCHRWRQLDDATARAAEVAFTTLHLDTPRQLDLGADEAVNASALTTR